MLSAPKTSNIKRFKENGNDPLCCLTACSFIVMYHFVTCAHNDWFLFTSQPVIISRQPYNLLAVLNSLINGWHHPDKCMGLTWSFIAEFHIMYFLQFVVRSCGKGLLMRFYILVESRLNIYVTSLIRRVIFIVPSAIWSVAYLTAQCALITVWGVKGIWRNVNIFETWDGRQSFV